MRAICEWQVLASSPTSSWPLSFLKTQTQNFFLTKSVCWRKASHGLDCHERSHDVATLQLWRETMAWITCPVYMPILGMARCRGAGDSWMTSTCILSNFELTFKFFLKHKRKKNFTRSLGQNVTFYNVDLRKRTHSGGPVIVTWYCRVDHVINMHCLFGHCTLPRRERFVIDSQPFDFRLTSRPYSISLQIWMWGFFVILFVAVIICPVQFYLIV